MAEATTPTISTGTTTDIKETLESIVIAFILAFIFRAFVVEAFIIPTGSMAPTLLGAHVRVTCVQCGYTFKTEVPDSSQRIVSEAKTPEPTTIPCPMCHYANVLPEKLRTGTGDRILVHKYIYMLAEPRRWDVVVFKAPHSPNTNFIKRLVGLPNEDLLIVEGNIYTKPIRDGASNEKDWKIARKTDRPKVQRTVWQPIYHSQYVPIDEGNNRLTQHGNTGTWTNRPGGRPWQALSQEQAWNLSGRDGYHYTGTQPTSLRFDFEGFNVTPLYAYDQTSGSYKALNSQFDREPIEDVRLACNVLPRQAGLSVTLSTTARWALMTGDGGTLGMPVAQGQPVKLAARIAPDGQTVLELPEVIDPVTRKGTVLRQAKGEALPTGRATALELWCVDQRLSLWRDGREVLAVAFELPIKLIQERPPLPEGYHPDVRIELANGPATLTDVELDRDLYYSNHRGSSSIARGGWPKSPLASMRHPAGPMSIAADQFFCLGDNSPLSEDGRYWSTVSMWVRHRMFAGSDVQGLVPRELMLGRAFFVYWPSMYDGNGKLLPVIPNFGDMRFIH